MGLRLFNEDTELHRLRLLTLDSVEKCPQNYLTMRYTNDCAILHGLLERVTDGRIDFIIGSRCGCSDSETVGSRLRRSHEDNGICL